MEKMEQTEKMVPDASVMLKWFLRMEELADKAAIIRNRFQSGELVLVIPRYALYEFSNVITLDKTGYTLTEARTALNALLKLKIKTIPFGKGYLHKSMAYVYGYKVPFYDACYLAVAEAYKAKWVTADSKAYKRVKQLSFVSWLGDIQ